ncbi:MAG: heavy-metal-associated domain-containing protein [Gammaproteobacteria bacterium AqS3]|nr:heavy-metal-associated domain-containing protein [Gammaproteobacteria bacterium AqS3]
MKTKTIPALLVLLLSSAAWAAGGHGGGGHDHGHDHDGHSHDGHYHGERVEGKLTLVDEDELDEFAEGLSGAQIAVVSVKGMVCDFCARGIEKTFKKDKAVQKVDVNLGSGIVLIAYKNSRKIDFDDIKKKILANGQSAVDLQIVKI